MLLAIALVMGPSAVFVLFGCMLFAAALFVYIFYQPDDMEAGEEKTRAVYLQERKEATYENLRDLNFEYKAGKLSEQDYAVQQAALEDEAAAILAELEQIEKARATAPRTPKAGLLGGPGTSVRQGTRPRRVRTNGGRA